MMDVFLGPGTYAGTPYAPDEVAKGLVDELKLKEGHTISKDQIIEYLGKCGLGPLWATDVAAVLRNMFGVTPIFYESTTHSGQLLEELNKIVSQEEETDTGVTMTDGDFDTIFSMTIEDAFNASESVTEDAVMAALSLESVDTIAEIAMVSEALTTDELDEAIAAYISGGDELIEDWYEVTFRPHLTRFMESSKLARLAEAIGHDVDFLLERVRSQTKQQRRQMANREMHMRARVQARADNPDGDVSTLKKRTAQNLARNISKQDRPDPLAQRASDTRNLAFRHHMDKTAAGMRASFGGHRTSAQGEKDYVNQQMQRGQARVSAASASPLPLPSHTPAQPHPVKRALSAVGRVASGVGKFLGNKAASAGHALGQAAKGAAGHAAGYAASKIGSAGKSLPAGDGGGEAGHEAPDGEHQSLGHKIGQGAHAVLGGIKNSLQQKASGFGDVMKAKLRVKHPGLAYALHGAPSQGELGAAQHLGMHHQYARMGHELPGYRQQIHSPAPQAQAAPSRKKKVQRSVPDNIHPAFASTLGQS